jgi:hypothetical protein
MDQKTKELWVIPTIVALVTGIPIAAVFMFLTAWATGVPIHNPLTLSWVKPALFAQLPVWATLIVVAVAAVIAGMYFRQRARTADEKGQKAALRLEREFAEDQLAKLQADAPKLHVAWNTAQTFWSLGQVGPDRAMQIGGWAHISSSNTKEPLIITNAFLEGTEGRAMLPVNVPPGRLVYTQFMAFCSPVLAKPGQPFKTRLIATDHQNRRYVLEENTFRWIGSQKQIDEALEAGKEEPPLFGDHSISQPVRN